MKSAKDIIAGMDFDSMLKEIGADKPKQTRPHDNRWCNNAIQFRSTPNGPWHFFNFSGQILMASCPKEWDFKDGKEKVEEMNRTMSCNGLYEFRLVAILEVM